MLMAQNARTRRDPALRRTARLISAHAVRPKSVRPNPVRPNPVRPNPVRPAEAGAATAEYIVATMAAVGFAGLLIVILRGDEVRGILTELVRSALTVG